METDERESQGAIVLVDPDTPLYDFGPMKNWKRLMGERWWEWFSESFRSIYQDLVYHTDSPFPLLIRRSVPTRIP
jgi:hypothetical protein